MKQIIFLLFLLGISNVMAYEIKWSKQPFVIQKQNNKTIKAQSIKGLFFSKHLPIKQVASILNIEVENQSMDQNDHCGNDFFPHKGINLENTQFEKVKGVDVIHGLWKDGFKYTIITCVKTEKGFKTSTALIRLPFVKRAVSKAYMMQLDFSKDLFSNQSTTYFQQLKDIIVNIQLISNANAQIPDLDPLTDALTDATTAVGELNTTIGDSTTTFNEESDEWQAESERWRNISSSYLDESEAWRLNLADMQEGLMTESEAWRSESEAWRSSLSDTQSWLDEKLSSGNLFKMAVSTAAGAALGSFGMSMALNGITSGLGNLIEYIANTKGRRIENYNALKEAFDGVAASFDKMGSDLDKLVLNLPLLELYEGNDVYSELEVILEKHIDARKGIIAANLKIKEDKITELENLGALYLEQDDLVKVAQVSECITQLTGSSGVKDLEIQINKMEGTLDYLQEMNHSTGKNYTMSSICQKINEMLKKWREAEASVVVAQALLRRASFIRSTEINDNFKEMSGMLNESKIKSMSEKDIKKTERVANKILIKAQDNLSKDLKEKFNQRKFKRAMSKCSEHWCHGNGNFELQVSNISLFGTDQSCAFLLKDIRDGKVLMPPMLSNILFEEGITQSIDEVDMSRLSPTGEIEQLMRLRTKRSGQCFRDKFKDDYSDQITETIGCDNFDQVMDFSSLASCSKDYRDLKMIHGEVIHNLNQSKQAVSAVGEDGDLVISAAISSMGDLRDHTEDLRDGLEILQDPTLNNYKHQELFDTFCSKYL